MIDQIVSAALEPFTSTVGWQAFAYGVAGKLVMKRAHQMYSGAKRMKGKGASGDGGE